MRTRVTKGNKMLQEEINKLLQTLSVEMSEEQKQIFDKHVEDELEQRITGAITELLDAEQQDEYARLSETASDEEINIWLEKYLPEYKDVISDEVAILLGDIAENSEHL